MFSLSELLDRYRQLSLPDETLRQEIIKVIKKTTAIELEIEQVKVRNFSFSVEAEPIVKSVIYMAKGKILTELKSQLGKKAPQKIIF